MSGIIDNNNPGQHRVERSTAWDNPGTGFDFDRGPRTANGSIPSSTFPRPSNGADVGVRF